MAIHEELNPDDAALPFLTARGMRVLATDNSARTAGVIVVPNRDGTDTVLGTNGLAPWVGDTTPPGRPLDIEATSHLGTALIRWGGELEGGIPSDFRCVQIWAKQVGATADEKTLVGVLSSAGEVNTGVFDAGTTLDVWATALDNAHDRDGSPAYNESAESAHVQVGILPIVSQQEFDEAADNILAAAEESTQAQIDKVNQSLADADKKIDAAAAEAEKRANENTAQHIAQVNKDLAAASQKIDDTAAKTLAAANKAAEDNLNRVQEEIAGEGGKIAQAANSAYERAKEHADELKAQVDAEFVAADKKISDTANSAYERAKDYTDGIKAQVDSDLVATGEAIDAAADKALADAKADTAKHVAQVNKDISDANEQIAANKTAVETEARLRAEGDKLAQEAAAAVKAETDKLATKYDTMDTDVKSVKSDLTKVMSSTTQLEQDMIVSTLIEYAVGDSDTVPPDLATYWLGEPNNSVSVLSDPWGPDTPERTPGTYIWMRTQVTFGDGGQETSAPVLVTGNTGAQGPQGVPGEPGADGLPGAAGTNGKTSYLHLAYANSSDGRTGFSTSDSNRDYIGQYTDFTQQDSTDPSKYAWSRTKGAQGATGAQGVSVSALTPFWQLAESKPSQPVNKAPGGGWSSTEPAYVQGKKLWTCSRVDYSNGQWSWTSVQQSSAFEAAELALTTANGKNRRYVQPSTPVVDTSELTQGDEWWQTSSKPPETYWLGEPNNSVSVLVDHSGDVEHIWVWNGTRWALNRLSAEDILVSGTVAAGLVTADFFDGARIKGGEFLTSNELIRLNNAGLIMNGKSGERLVTLNATDGTATFNSVSIINGALNAGTIEGAAINGGSFTLRDKDGRAIGHLNSSGMDLGDVLSFAKKDGEWQLSIKGGIKAGSTISGASIVGDSTVTGGVVQTTPAANRGIKLAGGNLDIYRSDEKRFLRANENGLYISDGSRNVLSFSRVWRTYWEGEPNNSVSVLSGPWQLTLDGAIQSGGEITGAVITGGTVQTNAAANRGIKLADSNLDAYTAAGSRFLRLNEAGMWFKDGDANALSFTKDSTGRMVLTIHDAIQTDGDISGATVTGCVVQTVAAANRGIKLKDNNLDVFSASGKLVMQANEAGIRFKDASGADKATFRPDANGVWNLRLTGMVSTGGAISGGTVTGSMVQTTASANHGVKMYSGDTTTGNLDVYRADGQLFLRANEDGLKVKDGKDPVLTFAKDEGTWKLKLSGPVTSGGEISGATITGPKIRTSTAANTGIKIYDNTMDFYRASDNTLFARISDAGFELKDGTTPVFTFAKDEASKWVLSLKGAIQSGGTISGATVVGATIRTNTQWESTDPEKKYRGLVITDGGMFAYKGNGKKEYSMAFTAATGELKLDGAVAANASLTGATINGGVVYGATVTTNSNYASTDPTLRDRGVWIKSNGLVAYNASNLETVRIDAASGRLWTRDGISTNGAFSVLDMSERPLLELGADTNGHATFTIYANDLDPAIDRRRLQYVDHTSNNHRTFSLWGNNNVAYQTQTGWDSARVQSPCVDLGLQTARRGGLVVFRGRVSAPNSGDNTLIANIGLVAGEAATKWANFETYGTNRSAVAVGFRNNTVQPCIVYIPANTRQLVAMNGPWDWVDLTGVTFGQ